VAARSKECLCGRSLVGDCGFEYRLRQGCLTLVSAVCWQVAISESGWSLAKGSSAEFGLSECDREASIIRRPWPTKACHNMGKKVMALSWIYWIKHRRIWNEDNHANFCSKDRKLPGRGLKTKPPEYEDGNTSTATFDGFFCFYIIITRFLRWECVSISFVSPSQLCT
jgi:hypothetical protein